jgi:hypothetical protein
MAAAMRGGSATMVQRNLQSRLQAARAERRKSLPTVPVDAPITADDETGIETDPAGLPQVIDLRTIRSMRQAAEHTDGAPESATPAPPAWNGSPTSSIALLLQRQAARRGEAVPSTNPVQERCPGCGGAVRLDMFDMIASLAHLTCLDCGFLFTARSPRT